MKRIDGITIAARRASRSRLEQNTLYDRCEPPREAKILIWIAIVFLAGLMLLAGVSVGHFR